jgi:hypothetical protein
MLGGRFRGAGDAVARLGWGCPEAEALHLLLEVAARQVAVHLGRDAGVLVAHDPLDRRQVGAVHEQERGGRVPEVVEPDLPNLPNREQLEVALRAAARVRVCSGLLMPAAVPPALVDVASHQARSAHRPPEHLLERRVPRKHLPFLIGEDQL